MALKHIVSGTRSGFSHLVDKVEHIAIAGVLVAAIIVAVKHGLDKGSDPAMKIVFAIVLVAAVAMEFRACKQMVISFYQKHLGSAAGWFALWAVCAVSTLYVSFGTAAKNVDDLSAAHKAEFVSYGDVRNGRDEAKRVWEEERANVARAKEQAYAPFPQVAGRNVETVAAAAALIAAGMADGFYARTKQCTDAKGKMASAHCNALGEAIAAKSALEGRPAKMETLKAAEAKLALATAAYEAAKGTANTTKTRVSDDAPHLAMLAAVTGWDEKQSRIADGMQLPILIQALLSIAALLMAIEYCRTLPRSPWFNWAEMWNGKAETPPASQASQMPDTSLVATKLLEQPATGTTGGNRNITVNMSNDNDVWKAIHKALSEPKAA